MTTMKQTDRQTAAGSAARTLMAVVAALAMTLAGCTAKRTVVSEGQTHRTAIDSASVEQMIGSAVAQWQQRQDSVWSQWREQIVSQQTASEQETELTTETVTESVDSLGRRVRQEQRTVERRLSREQQQREERTAERLTAEMHQALERRDSLWQQRLSAVETRLEQADSLARTTIAEPAAQDRRPLLRRLSDAAAYIAIGGIIGAIALAWVRRKMGK